MTGRFGKPDATGRSSGKLGGRAGMAQKPPAGEPWTWLTRELLSSEAWRSLSINARRFIDFLLIEHMNHAGTENGRLMATYAQLESHGLHPNKIKPAIDDCEQRGLVECQRGGMRVATTYRLTWLPDRDGTPASNNWKIFKTQKSALTNAVPSPSQMRAGAANLPALVRVDTNLICEGPSISRMGSTEIAALRNTKHAAESRDEKFSRRGNEIDIDGLSSHPADIGGPDGAVTDDAA
jgi:hypothetical protein